MATRKPKELKQGLKNKGFKESNQDHKFYFLYIDGKRTPIKTKVSHGSKEYGDGLLIAMKHQVRLDTKQQFLDLVDCDMTKEEYIQFLIEKKIIQS